MRRIYHLLSNRYLCLVGGDSRSITVQSGQYVSKLQSLRAQDEAITLKLFAKFNSELLNGINIVGFLAGKSGEFDSVVDSFKVYRIADGSWFETFVAEVSAVKSGIKSIAYLSQSGLGLNELSGAETYAIEAVARRRGKIYRTKVYVNHFEQIDIQKHLQYFPILLRVHYNL